MLSRCCQTYYFFFFISHWEFSVAQISKMAVLALHAIAYDSLQRYQWQHNIFFHAHAKFSLNSHFKVASANYGQLSAFSTY